MAHTAIVFSEAAEIGSFGIWYAEQAKALLCMAADAVSLLERPGSAVN